MKRTSLLANSHMDESGKRISHKEVILHTLREKMSAGGGTFEEIARAAGLGYSQVWKRLSELEKSGAIRDSGLTRPLGSGCEGTIWQIISAPGASDTQSTAYEFGVEYIGVIMPDPFGKYTIRENELSEIPETTGNTVQTELPK